MYLGALASLLKQSDITSIAPIPQSCNHKLDRLSLVRMQLSEHQINKLMSLVENDREKNSLSMIKLNEISAQNLETKLQLGFAQSYLLWSHVVMLAQTHSDNCKSLSDEFQEEIVHIPIVGKIQEITIESMDIPIRAKNVLHREGKKFAVELAEMSSKELLEMAKMGNGTLQAIDQALTALGIRLKDSVSPNNVFSTNLSALRPELVAINELGLSTRSTNGLLRAGILTLSDLLRTSDEDIRDIRFLGTKSLDEIKKFQEKYESKGENLQGSANYSDSLKVESLMEIAIEKLSQELDSRISLNAGSIFLPISLRGVSHMPKFYSEPLIEFVLKSETPTMREYLSIMRNSVERVRSLAALSGKILEVAWLFEVIDRVESSRKRLLDLFEKTELETDVYEGFTGVEENWFSLDDATRFLLDIEESLDLVSLGKEQYLDFTNEIMSSFVALEDSWQFMQKVTEFIQEFGVFPNRIGLLLGGFGKHSHKPDEVQSLLRSFSIHVYGEIGERNFEVLRMRTSGNKLDSIGEVFGLTRERIRQLVIGFHDASPEIIELINNERNAHAEKSYQKVIEKAFTEKGALTREDLATLLSVGTDEVMPLVPKKLRKFVYEEEREWAATPAWTKEATIAALQKASTYHFPLKISDYENLVAIGEIVGPSAVKVYHLFGTWSEACRIAGVESVSAPNREYNRLWNDQELISFVVRYLRDKQTSGTFAGYSKWRTEQVDQVPSEALIRIQNGNWTTARNRALDKIREEAEQRVQQ